MANCFLTSGHEEVETAILLEKAVQMDLSIIKPEYKNAVAFTDGTKVFVNSDDNLARVLPDYNQGMLKWLLWHEEYHKQLKHHNRFYAYLDELKEEDTMKKFHLTKDEVNIIMDILVHDSLSKMFPELIETAVNNLAQMRNRNSLEYTFKTHNLEDMLDEFAKYKNPSDEEKDDDKGSEDGEDGAEGFDAPGGDTTSKPKSKDKDKDKSSKEDPKGTSSDEDKPGHAEGGSGHSHKGEDKEDTPPDIHEETPGGCEPPEDLPDEHDKTDWSKLEDRCDEEFITESESDYIMRKIEDLKRKKFKLAKLTETLNGMVTTTKVRTYARPSYVGVDKSIMLKGRKYAKTSLYLIFDASGSMGEALSLFKEVISKAVPQAMEVPTEWFAGSYERIKPYKTDRGDGYFKGTFKDIMPVWASSGYNDDGDRVIELCLKAEEKGYTPIGITDGGGSIYRPETLRKLQKTVLIGNSKSWLQEAKEINPRIQILDI